MNTNLKCRTNRKSVSVGQAHDLYAIYYAYGHLQPKVLSIYGKELPI